MEQNAEDNSPCKLHRNQMKTARTPNVWFVPINFFSHVASIARLAQIIAGHGVSATLLATKEDIQRFQDIPSTRNLGQGNLQGQDIQFRRLGIQSAVLADGIGGTGRFVGPFAQIEAVFEEILNELEAESRPTFVIADVTLPGILDVAKRFSIPVSLFSPCSAGQSGASAYIKRLESSGILNLPDKHADKKCLEEVISVPGLPLMTLYETGPGNFKDYPLYERGLRASETLSKADVILLSTFEELESRPLQGLRTLLKACAVKNSTKMTQVWPVGPTFPFPCPTFRTSASSEVNGKQAHDVHPAINFLDSQAPCSVVYVAFGYDVNLPREQIHELAHGLEDSHQPFLCALQPPKKASSSDVQVQDIFSVLPPGILERTAGRGLFLRWVPQLEVLSHPSTGGFISHCGQNSLLESVCLGVPILAWPCQYDQFLNCRVLVDEAQIALEVYPRLPPAGIVGRKDVQKVVNTLFYGDEGLAVRNRALQMKQRAEESVGENGSSTKNLRSLLALIQDSATTTFANVF